MWRAYWTLSHTIAINSDDANTVLEGNAMSHGNLLLRGWSLTEASFYTTDLPLYAIATAVHRPSPEMVHVIGAGVYAVTVVAASFLARGGASGLRGLLRTFVTLVILLAPPPIHLFLAGPGHTGTTLVFVLALLALDRLGGRWRMALFTLLLTLDLIGNPLALFVFAPAIIVVSSLRLISRRHETWGEDIALLGGTACATAVSRIVLGGVHALSGFRSGPVLASFSGFDQMPRHLGLTVESLLALFGADFFGLPLEGATAGVVVHLLGLGFIIWVLASAARAWHRGLERDRITQILMAAMVANLLAYLLSRQAVDVGSMRYLTPFLVSGAVLAGRAGGDRLLDRRLLAATLAASAVYAGFFAVSLRTPAEPESSLGAWLEQHQLRHGLGAYWQASVVTLTTHGFVTVRAVRSNGATLASYNWASAKDWYRATNSPSDPDFLVFDDSHWIGVNQQTAVATFGSPSKVYRVGRYTILVWSHDLLHQLPDGPCDNCP